MHDTEEDARLTSDSRTDWLAWGPYLSDRQWGTVREDYSEGGNAWSYFPHDHARARAYRWGEDGIAGLSDSSQRLCFALSLWNGKDPILKERFFGLTNDEGNHGEDVKDVYFYTDATPTHSWLEMSYKYPQRAFPYADLVAENARRKAQEPSAPEFELVDTGIFDDGRYFDLTVTYAKRSATDILIAITARNCGPERSTLCLLPTLWFRNTWSWGKNTERPRIAHTAEGCLTATHPEMDSYRLVCPEAEDLLFCENETNTALLYGAPGPAYPKDGINDHVVSGADTVNPERIGTKASALYRLDLAPGEERAILLRLTNDTCCTDLGPSPDRVFENRRQEADDFHGARLPKSASDDRKAISRQALSGMIWSKQYFNYNVAEWLDGDDIPPPASRLDGRNRDWRHFYAEDIISMPDTWEYPWFASWDLCFHTVALARVDLQFAKEQVLLLSREWYMRPDGQIPAYEWAFDDVNPPLQAWAALKILEYERDAHGKVDRAFLQSVFNHGLLYFSWWVNRKDTEGNNLYQGGFLGLDNISVFDRSSGYLPGGGKIYQSDGTAWVGFFALQMMEIALVLAEDMPEYGELAAKFFQHFLFIADAIDHVSRETKGAASLWSAQDGLFFDVLKVHDSYVPLKARSLVSLIPMIAAHRLDPTRLDRAEHGGFQDRLAWFREEQADLLDRVTGGASAHEGEMMLSFLSKSDLARLLRPMLDEAEFLSDFGIRSMSRHHAEAPFRVDIDGDNYEVAYQPAESSSGLFGGNSNWRGPIWMPINYLLVDALRAYGTHYGDRLKVECPTGSGNMQTLDAVADEISRRLIAIFEKDGAQRRPVFGGAPAYSDPNWAESILFYEYFHGDNGAGIGAAHQTGWTGMVAVLIEEQERARRMATGRKDTSQRNSHSVPEPSNPATPRSAAAPTADIPSEAHASPIACEEGRNSEGSAPSGSSGSGSVASPSPASVT